MEASEQQTYADFMESIEKEAGVEILNKDVHDYDAIKQDNTLPVTIHSDEGVTVDGELVILSGEAVLRVPETLPDTKMVVMGRAGKALYRDSCMPSGVHST